LLSIPLLFPELKELCLCKIFKNQPYKHLNKLLPLKHSLEFIEFKHLEHSFRDYFEFGEIIGDIR